MLRIRRKYLETDRPALAFRLGLLWAEATAGPRPTPHALDWTSAAIRPGASPGRFRFEFGAKLPGAEAGDPDSLVIAYDVPLAILLGPRTDHLVMLAFLKHSELFLGAFRAGQRGAFLCESAALLESGGPTRVAREGGLP